MHSHHNMTRMTLRLMRISIPFCQPQAQKRGGVAADIAARDAGGMVGPAVALEPVVQRLPAATKSGTIVYFRQRTRRVTAMLARCARDP